MSMIVERYKEYLQEQDKTLSQAIDELKADDRLDEANHKKIEKNVVDIFSKMFIISAKEAGDDIDRLQKAYFNFFDKIPQNWYSNLERCKQSGNEEGQFVEELKIARKDMLKDKFLEMM